jgi:methionyl-tRNA synthetase
LCVFLTFFSALVFAVATQVLTRFPVDSFRFFVMREASYGGDVTFSETALALRHNAELADNFGNLVNRSLALCQKYNGGKVPSQAAEPVIDVGALRAARWDTARVHTLLSTPSSPHPPLHTLIFTPFGSQ